MVRFVGVVGGKESPAGCQPRQASGLRMQRAARLAWVGARGGVACRGWGNAAGGPKLATAVLTGTGGRLGPGRPGARPATKARWGYARARRAAGGVLRRPVPSFPPARRRHPRTASQGGTPRHDARRLGAREPSGRAASRHATSGGSESGRGPAVRRGAPAHDVVVRRRPAETILQCPCLNTLSSKNLYKSAPSGE
jgi:hypothetical protein